MQFTEVSQCILTGESWKHEPSDVLHDYHCPFLIVDLAIPPSPSLRVGYSVVTYICVCAWLKHAWPVLFDIIVIHLTAGT